MALSQAKQPWVCHACTCENHGSNQRCEACEAPRPPEASSTAAAAAAAAAAGAPPRAAAVLGVSNQAQWRCRQCQFDNALGASACDMCSSPRLSDQPLWRKGPGSEAPPAAPPLGGGGGSSSLDSIQSIPLGGAVSFVPPVSISLTRSESDLSQADVACLLREMESALGATGDKYIDPDFPPGPSSLFLDPLRAPNWTCASCNTSSNPSSSAQCLRCGVRWLRVSQWLRSACIKTEGLHSHRPRQTGSIMDAVYTMVSGVPEWANESTWSVFRGPPSPTMIRQGALGDCWLISAISVLAATQPEMLMNVVLTRDVSPIGAYHLRLCIDGVWVQLIIDDLFPATPEGGLASPQGSTGSYGCRL